jgi:hypothetical protein
MSALRREAQAAGVDMTEIPDRTGAISTTILRSFVAAQ